MRELGLATEPRFGIAGPDGGGQMGFVCLVRGWGHSVVM